MKLNKPTISKSPNFEKSVKIGLFTLFAVFGVFGLWAAFAPLEGAAYAPGTVTVKSYKKTVQHLEGGIVADILVRDGDLVEAGQQILVLDDTQPKSQLELINSQRISLVMREARLLAERDGLPEVIYPSNLEIIDAVVAREMSAQDQVFEARKTANAGRTRILQQRVTQLRNQITGLEAQQAAKESLANSFAEEIADTEKLLSQGFSDKNRLRELERNYASFSGEAAELTANIAAAELQVGETELQIIQQSSDFHNEVVTELSEVQTSINDANERLNAIRDIVSRTSILAPDSGIINGMQIHTIGGVLGPGSPIAEIVPESDDLVIEASVSPIDIDRVAEGQEARIRFSTFGSRAPTFFGTVLTLSADSLINETTRNPYYLARIQINSESAEDLGELVLLPGMPAEAFINTGSRTFLQYLFKPLSNAVARSFNED